MSDFKTQEVLTAVQVEGPPENLLSMVTRCFSYIRGEYILLTDRILPVPGGMSYSLTRESACLLHRDTLPYIDFKNALLREILFPSRDFLRCLREEFSEEMRIPVAHCIRKLETRFPDDMEELVTALRVFRETGYANVQEYEAEAWGLPAPPYDVTLNLDYPQDVLSVLNFHFTTLGPSPLNLLATLSAQYPECLFHVGVLPRNQGIAHVTQIKSGVPSMETWYTSMPTIRNLEPFRYVEKINQWCRGTTGYRRIRLS
ncbi:hypothetical protein ACJU26_09845 [Acidithiobacillus sp. M4-SHS-6]|uniref:hypothetical protein n=1 Tax=Acidithiobacillus sp. M4-SHS-6 TaxID=3383024 RepID=UPI0039BE7377